MIQAQEKFDGPRRMRSEEAVDSERLFRICFGLPEVEESERILAEYVPPRRGGTYVIAHDGKLVSQIGVWHDQVNVYDGAIRTGSIGGVGTHPDYRRQGLASRLLEHCALEMVKEGARLMLISGDGEVYLRAGNIPHGKFLYFSIKAKQVNQGSPQATDLVVRRATPADALTCSLLYQVELIHYVRSKGYFASALPYPERNTYIHADQWIVERSGQAVGYLFLGIPYHMDSSARFRQISEYAGSRLALAEAIPLIMEAGSLQEISWPVAWQDTELIYFFEKSGFSGTHAPLEGHTLRILDFPGFMKDLRPILQARLDAKLLRGLRFEQSGPVLAGTGEDRYVIVRGRERLELDGAAMTRLVMGSTEPQDVPLPSGALAEVIAALFPLPSFLPGLNYR